MTGLIITAQLAGIAASTWATIRLVTSARLRATGFERISLLVVLVVTTIIGAVAGTSTGNLPEALTILLFLSVFNTVIAAAISARVSTVARIQKSVASALDAHPEIQSGLQRRWWWRFQRRE